MATDSLRLYGAIDLGGTRVRSIVAVGGGRILGKDLRPSQSQDGLDVVLERMVESLDASVAAAGGEAGGVRGLGVAPPGASGAAGERGHVVLDMNGPPCGCGARGCLESLASGTAIAEKGEQLLDNGKSPILARLRAENGPVTAEMMHRAADLGDNASREVFREAGHYFGGALASYGDIFDPEVIVVGGGVAKAGDLFLDQARVTMEDRAMAQPLKGVRLIRSELGDFGGPRGRVARRAEAEEGRA